MSDAMEKAIKHANDKCPEQGREFIAWCMCRDDFLAGYAEAMRWRKFPDEAPTKTGEYLVQMDDNDNCGPYFTSHLYSPDCGWNVQIGQSILCWKEIGELPEGEK